MKKYYIPPILIVVGLVVALGLVGSLEIEGEKINKPLEIATAEAATAPNVTLISEGCDRVDVDDNWKERVCRFRDADKKVTCWMVLSVYGRGLSCVSDK